ncbi:hypothetical protein ACDF64_16235 [Agromyces sp. MMS24-JH15]|uniref:hypothetical protein n=1 Tax=Agromyces sp. MMS24-JH15 TaxID=3243765 RepID=UPI003749188B
MTVVGFHASHEQVSPQALLRAVQRAEDAGFQAARCSDHPASRAGASRAGASRAGADR